jgi:ferrous iron transport protein B
VCRPHRLQDLPPALDQAVRRLTAELATQYPQLANARWVALRLLEGDARIREAVRSSELGQIESAAPPLPRWSGATT